MGAVEEVAAEEAPARVAAATPSGAMGRPPGEEAAKPLSPAIEQAADAVADAEDAKEEAVEGDVGKEMARKGTQAEGKKGEGGQARTRGARDPLILAKKKA